MGIPAAILEGARRIPRGLLALVLLASPGLARAQAPAPSAEHLTHTLVSLVSRYRAAVAPERDRLLGHLLAVAAARRDVVAGLMDSDPGAVLRVAVPPSLRASLPPVVQNYVEEAVELEGVVEVLHEDRDAGSRYLYFLRVGDERLSLHFAAAPPDLLTGDRIRVRGVRIGNAVAL
jgi:hypothetical protein